MTLFFVRSERSTALLAFLQPILHQLVQVFAEIRQLGQAEGHVACLTPICRAYPTGGQCRASQGGEVFWAPPR